MRRSPTGRPHLAPQIVRRDRAEARNDRARLLRRGAVIHAADAGDQHRGDAHRARFAGRVEIAAGQIDGLEPAACVADRLHLAVRGRIEIRPRTIDALADDRPVAHDHRSERTCARLAQRLLRQRDGAAHECLVVHCSPSVNGLPDALTSSKERLNRRRPGHPLPARFAQSPAPAGAPLGRTLATEYRAPTVERDAIPARAAACAARKPSRLALCVSSRAVPCYTDLARRRDPCRPLRSAAQQHQLINIWTFPCPPACAKV